MNGLIRFIFLKKKMRGISADIWLCGTSFEAIRMKRRHMES